MGLIIEGCIEGKNGRGRPWMEHMQQIIKDQGYNFYEETKRKESNRDDGELLETNLRIEYRKEEDNNW